MTDNEIRAIIIERKRRERKLRKLCVQTLLFGIATFLGVGSMWCLLYGIM
ncbi:MAG: hypothetical protein MJZ12_01855 [Prevotella sp.]|nr:hypothetical protein [Prevotella sp.]